MNHSDNRTTMVAASFVLALISIITFQIFFISLPSASVSIILALISRGDGPMLPRAKAALACAAAGAVLTTSITLTSVYAVMHDPVLRSQVEQIYEYYTDPEALEDPSEEAPDGQALIRDILSGKYRKQQQDDVSDSASSSSAEGNSGESVSSETPLSSLNGGRLL